MRPLGFLFFLFALNSVYGLKIEITQGSVTADPIAILPFCDSEGRDTLLGRQVATVIGNDLESSGLFSIVPSNAYIQTCSSLVREGPRLSDWRLIKSRFLVYGTTIQEGGSITLNFFLYDIITGQMMLGLSLTGETEKWRKIAHMVSDKIYERITNEMGYFNTMVVYVEPLPRRGKEVRTRLIRMDYDGANAVPLTDGSQHIINPVYSYDGNWIIYGAYTKEGIKTYLMNVHSKSKELLGNFNMLNFAARFSPDSKHVVLSLVKNGRSAIHIMDLNSRKTRQITPYDAIDTSPCFSPTGEEVVFTSDRHGKEGLYIMNSEGGNVRRITFGEGKYSQPIWSPRGDYIAFTKQIPGQFFIGVIRPDGTDERYIASGYLTERPTFAPNGRVIMYTLEPGAGGKSYIYQVDITGRNIRQVPIRGNGFDATWSPLYISK